MNKLLLPFLTLAFAMLQGCLVLATSGAACDIACLGANFQPTCCDIPAGMCYGTNTWVKYESCGDGNIHCCGSFTGTFIGLVAGAVALFCLCCVLCCVGVFCCCCRSKKEHHYHQVPPEAPFRH